MAGRIASRQTATEVSPVDKEMRGRSAVSEARPAESRAATPPSEALRRQIAEAAYYRALERGFAPGQEMEDWLQAEAAVKTASAGLSQKSS
jgi:hypothetical protein